MVEPFLCLGGCGRHLRAKESLARGYGSTCWQKLHGTPAPASHASHTPVEVGEGQTVLDLIHHQPSLWSM